MKKQRSLEDWLYLIGIILLILGVIGSQVYINWIAPNMPPFPCVLWSVFGAYCPGCGGTRALNSFLQGRFLESLWYHPMIMYTVVLYVIFMCSHTLRKLHITKCGMTFRAGYLYGALIIIVVNFVGKNLLKFCFGIVMM